MKLPIGILLLAAVAAVAQSSSPAPRRSATPAHFRWSERLAHELDYKHTLRGAKELSPSEKETIVEYISHQMLAKGETEDMSGPMSKKRIREFAQSTRVEMVNLKGDGTRTILAQAPWIPLCGATGNCSVWIFEFSANGFRVLLDGGAFGDGYEKVLVRPWSTNGYRDVVLGAHASASERQLDLYQYRNGEYRLSACYWLSRIGDDGQPLNRPSIFPIKCN